MPPCTSSAMPPPSPSAVVDKANHYHQPHHQSEAAATIKTMAESGYSTEQIFVNQKNSNSVSEHCAQILPAPDQKQLEQTRLSTSSTSKPAPQPPADQTTTTISESPFDQTLTTVQTNNNIPQESSLLTIKMNPKKSVAESERPSLSNQCPSINDDIEAGDNEKVDFEKKEEVVVKTNGDLPKKTSSTLDLESGQPTTKFPTSESQYPSDIPRNESRLIAYLKRASNVSPFFHKWFSAILYAACSTLIMLINKIVLTSYGFPSFKILALGQMLATVVLLHLARATGIVTFPRFSFTVVRNIFPIPLLYAGNLLSGLGSTKRLNLPMYTVLRRVAILFTMIAEYYLLSISQTPTVQATVYMMVGGAVVAAFDDLAFDLLGYLYVLLNDLFTASYSVYIKKKLDANDLSKYGLLYYNALFMLVPILAISLAVDDWYACFVTFEHWSSPGFVLSFTLSCVMGFVLMYATVLCTEHNSALTTAIVGCLRSILVTYLGMFIGGDYIFSAINFAGVSISVLGSLIYTYVTFIQKHVSGKGGKKGKTDDSKEKTSEEEAKEETEKIVEDQKQVPENKCKQ